MKRLLWMVLVLLLVPYIVQAEELTLAGPYDFASAFVAYPGFSEDAEKESWSLVSHEICAAENYLSEGQKLNAFAGFYFSIQGTCETGLVIPALHIFIKHSSAKLEPKAASFLLNGIRYDFVGQSKETVMGNTQVEMMTIPLDASGVEFWKSVCASERIELQLYGKKTWSTVFEPFKAADTAQEYLFKACIDGSRSLLRQVEGEFLLDKYQLWDLNSAVCDGLFGVQPNISEMSLNWATEEEPFSQYGMGTISVGANGKAVKQIQEMLNRAGFFVGPADGVFGVKTETAILLAQKYYGLPSTGFADRRLANALNGTSSVDKHVLTGSDEGKALELSMMQLELRRYWYASEFHTARSSGALGSFYCDHPDEVLLVIDGTALSKMPTELIASMDISASLDADGITIPAQIFFETSDGIELRDSLLPKTKTQVVIIARVPRGMVNSKIMTLRVMRANSEVCVEFRLM